MNKLIILDRDGVINQDSDNYIRSADEWLPIPGSIEAIARLSKAGFTIVIATNQSGIARGYFDLDALAAMHQKLRSLVDAAGGKIDGIFICPHHPDDNCDCRKPKPGLLDQIASKLSLPSLSGAYFVGDSRKDIEAALARDCTPILVLTGKGLQTRTHIHNFEEPLIFDNLAAAADFILSNSRPSV